jgi:hypothetical protein
MASNQLIPYKLPTQTFSAGNNAVIALKDLPKRLLGRIAHLSKLSFSVSLTPTYTTAPTTVGNNNVVKSMEFNDGSFIRHSGGFNALRARERLHTGRTRVPDADNNLASASARLYRRTLHMGPPQMLGSPSDFLIPCGMLEGGELKITWGALTDISADTTVAVATVRIVAWLALLDEIRIPPAYEFTSQSLTGSDGVLPGRALYTDIAFLNSASFDAITADDFKEVTVDFGFGPVVNGIKCADLSHSFLDDFKSGQLDTVAGDPETANDDNGRILDRTTVAAVAAAPFDLQPIVYTPENARLTKLFLAESSVRVNWNGTQTTAVALIGRIKAQPQNVLGAALLRATNALGGVTPKKIGIKTLSKKQYSGPYGEFMPWFAKVG